MHVQGLGATLAASGYEQGAFMIDASTIVVAIGLLVMGVGLVVSKPKTVESPAMRTARQGLGVLLSLGAIAFPAYWFLTK